jgi:hypothetical protein
VLKVSSVWTVDVFFSRTFPVGREPEDWRRVHVAAKDSTEASLLACQIVGTQRGRTVVGCIVVDWPEMEREEPLRKGEDRRGSGWGFWKHISNLVDPCRRQAARLCKFCRRHTTGQSRLNGPGL